MPELKPTGLTVSLSADACYWLDEAIDALEADQETWMSIDEETQEELNKLQESFGKIMGEERILEKIDRLLKKLPPEELDRVIEMFKKATQR